MKLESKTYKAIQGFLLTGVPFVLFLYFNATIPFKFTVLALGTLMGLIIFLKLEVLLYMLLAGIDSVHDHMSHNFKQDAGKGGAKRVVVKNKEEAEELFNALTNIKDRLAKKRDAAEESADD